MGRDVVRTTRLASVELDPFGEIILAVYGAASASVALQPREAMALAEKLIDAANKVAS